MSPKHLTWLSDLTDKPDVYYDSTCQLFFFVSYFSLWENGIPQNWFLNVQRQFVSIKPQVLHLSWFLNLKY